MRAGSCALCLRECLCRRYPKAIFGSSNDRYVKSLGGIVKRINDLEPTIAAMDEATLKHQTVVLRERLAQGETMDDILPEAFATVRERPGARSASATMTSS